MSGLNDGFNDRLNLLTIAFAGAACCNCMQVKEDLLRCTKCKRVRYCNRDCQKQHYKNHKQECKLLEMFRDNYNDRNKVPTELPEKQLIHQAVAHEKVIRTFMATGQLAPVTEKSLASTRRFIMWARVCAHCKKNEYDLPVKQKGVCCSKCKFGWCCSQEHYDEYKRTGHHDSDLCGKFFQSTTIDAFRWNHAKNYHEYFVAVPDHEAPPNYDPPFTSCPNNWTEYFKTRCASAYNLSREGRLPREYLPAGTLLLSQPCTCLYAIFHHGLDQYTKGRFASESLTIHIVGASKNYEMPPMGNVWEELMHCLPAVGSLKTVFIGPEVGVAFPDDSKCLCLSNMGCCPVCTTQDRTRATEIFQNTYHGYKEDPKFSQPDLIVAFNTGLFEECTESWKTSVEVMLDMDVPCLFTSYAKDEAVGDYAVLESLSAKCLTDEAVLNPMRDFTPQIEPCPSLSTFHVNMYATGFKGRK